jgi:hypothetical protein
MIVPHRKHGRASKACYRDSFTLLYVDDVRTSQEIRTSLHGLLQGYIYFFIYKVLTTQETRTGLHGLLQG